MQILEHIINLIYLVGAPLAVASILLVMGVEILTSVSVHFLNIGKFHTLEQIEAYRRITFSTIDGFGLICVALLFVVYFLMFYPNFLEAILEVL